MSTNMTFEITRSHGFVTTRDILDHFSILLTVIACFLELSVIVSVNLLWSVLVTSDIWQVILSLDSDTKKFISEFIRIRSKIILKHLFMNCCAR